MTSTLFVVDRLRVVPGVIIGESLPKNQGACRPLSRGAIPSSPRSKQPVG